MKRKIQYYLNGNLVEKEVTHIPVRYIIAIIITVLEITAIIGIVTALCYYIPLFYLAAFLTEIFCVIKIIASDDNPDYKVPWLLVVLVLPIVGFMLYFLFYSRKLKKKYVKRLKELKNSTYQKDDSLLFEQLQKENPTASSQAKMLCNISESHLFSNTKQTYFYLGEEMHKSMLADLQNAQRRSLWLYACLCG